MAILWALITAALLMVLLMGFISRTASSRQRAVASHRAASADVLVDAAFAEAKAKLDDAFSAEGGTPRRASVTASPGLVEVRYYDLLPNRGSEIGSAAFAKDGSMRRPFASEYGGKPANPRWIPLFSWRLFAPHLPSLRLEGGNPAGENPDYNPFARFNINTPRQPLLPGAPLLSGQTGDPAVPIALKSADNEWLDNATLGEGQSSASRPVWVQWIPVLSDPAQPPSDKNRMIGRYAYWIDVENTKLRLDAPLESLADHPSYARLVGDSDADTGTGSAFQQGAAHPLRQARAAAEGLLPVPPPRLTPPAPGQTPLRHSWDGQRGPGFAPAVAADVRAAWFESQSNRAPLASATPWVDWDFLTALRPRGAANFSLASSLFTLRERQQREGFVDVFDLLPQAAENLSGNSEFNRGAFAALRSALVSSFTLSGCDEHEEKLDPLGYPKLNLGAWQRDVTNNRTAAVSLEAIRNSALWPRLRDPGYYRALYPGAWPTGGQARSFIEGFARMGGAGGARGEAMVLQMLTNIAEFAQPANVPPVIDEQVGIIGARSIPYVAEIATRARSALFLVDSGVRQAWLARALAGDISVLREEWRGKPFTYYASHVIVDLHAGLLNPDPFCTERFRGELTLDLAWHRPPGVAELSPGPFTATLDGLYTATPEPGNDPTRTRTLGMTASFRLGVVPGEWLDMDSAATALRLRGWRITRSGAVWHQVPLRHPGGSAPREWWAMAQDGANAGEEADANSLSAYRPPGGAPRAVGWFTHLSGRRLRPDALYLPASLLEKAEGADFVRRFKAFGETAGFTARMDRVVCEDPVIGHRTGDDGLRGRLGSGHFYGVLGHPWRRLPISSGERLNTFGYSPPLPGQTAFEIRELLTVATEYRPAGTGLIPVSTWQPGNLKRERRQTSIPFHRWTAEVSAPWRGHYATHTWMFPTLNQEAPSSAPDSLCGLLLCPAFEGPVPQGDPVLDLVNEAVTIGQTTLKDVEIEPPTGVTPQQGGVFKLDRKKGPRGFFCHAPAGRYMVTPGEIGFVHSGFPNRPIITGPDEGRTPWQINSPLHGPPMRLLLDLFTVPGGGASWNVNTAIAHDGYLALREGGKSWVDLKDDKVNPVSMAAHAAWIPNAQGHARRALGSEAFRGKSLKDQLTKKPGHALDRHVSPFPAIPRAWDMWTRVVAGDYSVTRAGVADLWGSGNALPLYFGAGAFTWQPGRGAGKGNAPWVDFAPDAPGDGRLLAFGTDARANDKNDHENWLRGRFAADQNLDLLTRRDVYMPLHHATRFSLFPLRHFSSDVPLNYTTHAEPADLRTALNPRTHSAAVPGATVTAANADGYEGCGFPGGAHSTGVFYQAPFALLTAHADTRANAFSITIVAQAINDIGPHDPTRKNSGPGHHDPGDGVLREVWSRIVIQREPNTHPPIWRVVSSRKLDAAVLP